MNILSIEKLRVDYGDFTALDITEKIDFQLGDRIGIIGGNGAGKTTFAKAICGLVNYKGTVNTELKQSDIAIHLQDNSFVKRMPVKIIMEAVFNTSVKTNTKLQEIINFFDFEPCLKKRYAQLSGGQKQKLALILVLMQDKQLTFFDEVTSGLDFENRAKLIKKLHEWYGNNEKTICIVSHYYDELQDFCNKLLVIDSGKIVAFDTVENLAKKYNATEIIIKRQNDIETIYTNVIKDGAK
ncbi:MAG: ATP-binding cassette domain-containing protein [Firmicutes bacterium]|nr:ATP-binding cassette domain-containing protein [Bacillota bacterium]